MMNPKINWNSEYLVPRFLKDFIIEENNNKKIKNFIIVSMLRNHTATNSETKEKIPAIIINNNLVTKPIDTTNLTTSFKKIIETETIHEEHTVDIFKIAVHINNKFNPTNIGLFDTKNHLHFYFLYGDNTLHVNIGLLTLFKILSSDSIKISKRK